MGVLFTDFNLIKAGALHRATGGYLLVDALKLLSLPYSYEGLKRAMQSKQIKIESIGEALSLTTTYSLEPEPVSLEGKIVLLGDSTAYYLLSAYDPEFSELFKVAADFTGQLDWSAENQGLYARLIAKLVREDDLKPLDREAVGRVIEHSARMLEDSEKISLLMSRIFDLLREADYWAGQAGRDVVTAEDVQRAIDAGIFRLDRYRDRIQEEIDRGILLLDTAGDEIGQVNGLSVYELGDFAFGRPTRITARVRLGKGEVIDIEREVELSGPIHSKGVLILSGFLGARYAPDVPLSLSASLVFEQSYGGVDGDSASSTELYALLSAISGVPIKQTFAVTGSVNQRGEVQAIGGANEKIEGFFDVCVARGLDGEQGVLIPASNVKQPDATGGRRRCGCPGQVPHLRDRDRGPGHRDPDRETGGRARRRGGLPRGQHQQTGRRPAHRAGRHGAGVLRAARKRGGRGRSGAGDREEGKLMPGAGGELTSTNSDLSSASTA